MAGSEQAGGDVSAGMPNPPPAFPPSPTSVPPPEPPSDQRGDREGTPRAEPGGERQAGGDGEPRPPDERSWFDKLLGRPPQNGASEQRADPASNSPAAAVSDAPPAGEAPPAPPGATAAAAPEPSEQPAPWTPPATREEEERRIQAEVDRRAAKGQRQQAQSTREQHRQMLLAQEREARETDAYKAAELRNQLDAMTAQEQVIQGMARLWDQATLDPLVKALPEAERQAVLAQGVNGIEGREALTTDVLHRLEAHWRADEARKLRSNPAFRKELLNARRAEGAADLEEPELVTNGVAPRRRGSDMDEWIRARLR